MGGLPQTGSDDGKQWAERLVVRNAEEQNAEQAGDDPDAPSGSGRRLQFIRSA